jgi:hypothetical protein
VLERDDLDISTALRELQRVDPKEPMWYNILGKVLTTLKRYDEANEQFRKVRGHCAGHLMHVWVAH